jgi:enamine deaminase RidA (YjgF/YER057c/UK114 family)
MEKPKQIVQPPDLPVRKSHSQVVAVTGGTLVFVAGMTSRSEKDAAPVHPGDMRAQLRQVRKYRARVAFCGWRLL